MADIAKTKNIKLHIEFLRFIFIFGIVYTHIYLPTPNEGWKACSFHTLFYTAKLAVPIFFMITGALLIPKEENWTSFISRRISRAIGFMLVFFTVQIAYLIYKGFLFTPFTLFVTFIRYIFNDFFLSMTGWFIYTYFALILLLPIIRILAKSLPDRLYIYLFLLQFIFCAFVPIVFTLLFHAKSDFYSSGCTIDAPSPYSTLYGVFYMLLGNFLENRCQISRRFVIILAISSAITLAIICTVQMAYNEGGSKIIINLLGFQPIYAAFIYIAAKRFFSHHHLPAMFNRIIIVLGGAAFTIMITENIFREQLIRHLNVDFLDSNHPFTLKIGLCIATCLCGFLVGIIMKRIPILNKFI